MRGVRQAAARNSFRMLNRGLGFPEDKEAVRKNTGGHRVGGSRILNLVFDNGRDTRRQWPRQLMILSARLVTVANDKNIRIRDLAPGGARIEGADLPAIGTDVLLKRGQFEAFGTIAWISGNQAGLEFDEALDGDTLDLIQKAREETVTPEPSHRRSGFGRKTSTHPRWSTGRGWIDG